LDHGPNRPGGRLGHGHFHDFYHLHRIPVLPSLHALTRPQRYLRLLHIVHDVFQRLRDGLPPQGTYTFHVSATASNQTVPALLTTNSPGARVRILDPRPATSRVMVYCVRNGA